MKIHLREDEIVLVILDYFRQKKLYRAMHALERDTHVTLQSYGQELNFLRSLILDGHFDDAITFLKPLERRASFDFKRCVFYVRRQRFLEMISTEKLTPAVVELVDGLKDLEDCCSKQEFNALCYCLTLKRLQDHPDYRDWNVYRGRIECFELLRPLLQPVYPRNTRERADVERMQPNRLQKLLKDAILYQMSVYKALHGDDLPVDKSRPLTGSLLHDFPDQIENVEERASSSSSLANSDVDVVIDPSEQLQKTKQMAFAALSKSVQLPRRQPAAMALTNANEGRKMIALAPPKTPTQSQQEEQAVERGFETGESAEMNRKSVSYFLPSSGLGGEEAAESPSANAASAASAGSPGMNIRSPSATKIRLSSCQNPLRRSSADHQFVRGDDRPPSKWKKGWCDADVQPSSLEVYDVGNNEPIASVAQRASRDASVRSASASASAAAAPPPAEVSGAARSSWSELRTSDAGLDIFAAPAKVFSFESVGVIEDPQTLRTVRVSPDGRFFALGSNSKTLRLGTLDAEYSPRVVNEFRNYHGGSVYCLDISVSSGRLIATGSNDRLVKLSRFDEQFLKVSEASLMGHSGTVRDLSFVRGLSSERLVSCGSGDNYVRIWDLERAACVKELRQHCAGAYYAGSYCNAHQNLYAAGGAEGVLRVFDLRTGELTMDVEAAMDIFAVEWSADGTELYAGLSDGRIMVINHRTGLIDCFLLHHSSGTECRSLHCSPDGKHLLSGAFDRTLAVTDIQSKTTMCQFEAHESHVVCARWHPIHDDCIVSTGADKVMRVWRNTLA